MLSLLVAGRLLGQVHHPLYALFATAFFFIFLNTVVIYEVSFQLSFIAVFLYYGSCLIIHILTKMMYYGNGYLNTA